jgi:hypothetical protein
MVLVMGIGKLAVGMIISYWKLAISYGYWLLDMGVVIDYMDKVKFGLLGFGVRISFMWVWMFGF